MRLLICGWQGQIAKALVAMVPGRADVTSFAVGRPARDLCEQPTLRRALSDASPDVIINAAAYTDIDGAESDVDEAQALNCDGARMMAEAATEYGAAIIQMSTDYVFDGSGEAPWREEDRPNPQCVYGMTKLAGERAVQAANPRHIILRTAWVYSAKGSGFVDVIAERAGDGSPVEAVADQVGSPTYATHLATTVLDLAGQIADRAEGDPAWGIYHAAGRGHASRYDMAHAIVDEMASGADVGSAPSEVTAVASDQFPCVVPRPKNARLSCGKLDEVFGLGLPHWREGVRECVAERLSDATNRVAPSVVDIRT
ncbi:MAG: dTDP-4-dehydrorhamnose reductase [Pseudomonadota bacterium]